MTIGVIDSLKIIGVYDHGVPNKERIAIRVDAPCDLSEYCLFLATPGIEGNATPVRDHMLWFGHGYVEAGDWIIVYTASGVTTTTNLADDKGMLSKSRVIAVHWGKDMTVFQNRAVAPMLVHLAAVAIPAPPAPQFQGNPQQSSITWGGHWKY